MKGIEEMRTHELSVSQQKLLNLMKKVSYGRINNLTIIKGEPTVSPESTIEKDIKLDAVDNRIPTKEDFQLKKKVKNFFSHLKNIGEGGIRKIEIRGGLPVTMHIEEKIV
jgi:hypothetical protein